MAESDAEHLWSYETAPDNAVFTLVELDCFESNRDEDRTRYVISVDDILYESVYYSGSADAYWESDIGITDVEDYADASIGDVVFHPVAPS